MSVVSVGAAATSATENGVVRHGRGSNRRRRGPRLRYLSLVALLVLWFVADKADWISADTFPGPGAVWHAAVDLAQSGKLADALQVSLTRVVIGGLIGVVLGVVLGLLSGFSHLAESVLDTPLQALRAVPFTALVPIFILWLGIGEAPKIAIVAFAVFFPVYINTYAGIRSVDVKYAEVAQVYGLSRVAVARRVLLPGALPGILVGIRYALALSWISVIVAEQLNASSGIGFLLVNARQFLQVDVMFVCLVLYALLGVVTDLVYRLVERRLLVWRRGFDGA
ncbi:ABC transporter permease [Nocardioides sp. CER19]|uniref:ABC transporter permease n=1 Tax=Nocardioides sp. CER19 TaxID=3038538 RepID=UPI0024476D01|nr:ABC transporter permease [Nocardioides sp. CER19]MDH2415200.1 ABC transporter permease [Nocardioides sp. CER19]